MTDLDAWAAGIVGALHDRGELLVFDDHPVALCVDAFARWQYDYFEEGFWRLGKIVTALARAGFHLEALEEHPGDRRIPGMFLLYARRESKPDRPRTRFTVAFAIVVAIVGFSWRRRSEYSYQ